MLHGCDAPEIVQIRTTSGRASQALPYLFSRVDAPSRKGMAHVDRPGVNRYRPNRAGPSHSFPVVRGPSVGLGRTGGTAPRRGRRQLHRSREDSARANRPHP